MFTKTLKTVVVSLAISIGGIAATAAPSNAGTLEIDFSFSGPGYYFSTGRDHKRRYGRRDHRRHYGRRGNWRHRGSGYDDYRYYDDGYSRRRRSCKPRRALRKARRMGVRDAYIVRVNRRGVVVRGYRYGRPAKIKFGRSRRCKVIVFKTR